MSLRFLGGEQAEPAGGRVTFLFRTLIQLRYIELKSATGRALNVVRMRNSNHVKNSCQFDIGEQGPEIGSKLEGVTGALGWSVLRAANAIP
jgi:circadian clock protein KaiC